VELVLDLEQRLDEIQRIELQALQRRLRLDALSRQRVFVLPRLSS